MYKTHARTHIVKYNRVTPSNERKLSLHNMGAQDGGLQ